MLKKIIIYLIFSSIILANGKPTAVDKEIIELSLNYQFEKADMLLEQTFNGSKNLKYHYLYLNIELVKSIEAAEKIPFKFKQAIKDSVNQVLIDYTEKIIEEYEDQKLTIDEQFYLGSIYGLLGRFHGVKKSWMSGFSNGKEGKNILEEVVEQDPNYIDAYLLLGMVNYYADRMGGITEFIASILGMSGDRNRGLKYLHKVEQEGVLGNWQGTMMLSEIYARLEHNKFDSLPLIKKFNEKFPNNTHFANWYCNELINLNMLKEADEFINSTRSDNVFDVIKAGYYHKVGEYQKSNEIYDTLLVDKGNIYPWVFEKGKYQRVINFLMLGNKNEAKSFLHKLSEHYQKRVNEFINNTELTKSLFNFRKDLLLGQGNVIHNSNLQSGFSDSQFAQAFYNYSLGIYYFQNNNYKLSEEKFIKSKTLDFENFGFGTSQYLIHIYKNQNVQKEKVEHLLDDIDELDNKGLDFSAQDLEVKYNL